MSFGWSVGDIAKAIDIIVKITKALNSAEGAAKDHREAIAFLKSLTQTLEPLRVFTVLDTYPSYQGQIRDQVAKIKRPIESFLESAKKFEQSLGSSTQGGRHRHIVPKLRWRFIVSKSVKELKESIRDDMRVLDSLIQRLMMFVCPIPPAKHF